MVHFSLGSFFCARVPVQLLVPFYLGESLCTSIPVKFLVPFYLGGIVLHPFIALPLPGISNKPPHMRNSSSGCHRMLCYLAYFLYVLSWTTVEQNPNTKRDTRIKMNLGEQTTLLPWLQSTSNWMGPHDSTHSTP